MKILIKILAVVICCYALYFVSSNSFLKKDDGSFIIGINSWTGYDPFIIADKKNLFSKNGINVKIKRFKSTVDEVDAIKNGKIDAGGFTLDEVFSLIDSGLKGKIVLVVDYSFGGDMLIGQQYITSVTDLVGKTVGYEGTVVGEFLLNRALEDNFIKPDSVELVNISADNWIKSFKEKEVDALVCFNPVSTILQKEYSGNLLYSSENMPFEIIDVLFIPEEIYNRKKETIKSVLISWFDTIKFIENNLDKSAEIISSVKGISPKVYKEGLKGLKAPDIQQNISTMNPKSKKNIYKYSQKIVDFMLFKGLLSSRINTSELFVSDTLLHLNFKTEP